MDLSKLSKSSLEGVVNSMLEDLDTEKSPLLNKYEDLICEMLYYIDENEAIKIVKNMKPFGEYYTMDTVENTLTNAAINYDDLIEYYLCMNMFYNDYKTYPESKRMDINDFCLNMSKLFINDIDAPKYKVEKYFKMYE